MCNIVPYGSNAFWSITKYMYKKEQGKKQNREITRDGGCPR